MRYVIAVLVCAGEFFAYAAILALLDTKPGLITMIILMSIVFATWTAITRKPGASSNTEDAEDAEDTEDTESSE